MTNYECIKEKIKAMSVEEMAEHNVRFFIASHDEEDWNAYMTSDGTVFYDDCSCDGKKDAIIYEKEWLEREVSE